MKERERFILPSAVVAGVASAMLASVSALAQDMSRPHGHGAHGHGHDQMHGWYLTLKQPNTGMSCCNNEDCRPTVARTVGGKVQVEIDGEWADVPPEKIVDTPSPDLGAHVCAPKQPRNFSKPHIYCVVLGSGA